ncbi:hypothetical protein B7463_g8971, partial [Scytalidium lignicola]
MAESNEKVAASPSEKVESINSTASPVDNQTHDERDLDDAYRYLNSHTDAETDQINLKALRRKIDWHIIPIMFMCYVLQFVDKVVINYAAVMGINKDLKLTKNDFSNVGSAFFIALLVAEVPTGYILQKVPPGKWLGVNVTLWGVCCAAGAGAFNYHSLIASRIFLGIFEAAIAPSLMLISSQYYNKKEQAPRFSIWYCGLGVGQVLGGLTSFAFQHVHNTSFKSWQAMFVFIGCSTSLIGIACFFILPDSPMKAGFLTETEKSALLKHVAENQTGIHNGHFKWSHIWEAVTDIQLWFMTICTVCISVSSGVVTTYSATLIQGMGFSSYRTALLNMPSGAVSIIAALAVGYGVRHTENRWAWLAFCCVPGMIGGGLMSFLPKDHRAGLLAGVYLVNAITGTLTVIYQWTMSNVAGHTKRTVAAALIAGSFSIGNIIGPQTFQAKDAPDYRPAKIAVMATQAGGAVMSMALFVYYIWANKQKDKKQLATTELPGASEELWDNKTDKENPNFRYVY